MAITTLDVVNACLDTMGESPLNELDADHPYVNAALNKLNQCNILEQSRGWWFNTDYLVLSPDSVSGYVYVPGNALDADPGYPALTYRSRRIYNRTEATYDIRPFLGITGQSTLPVTAVQNVPFEDLPPLAQQMIAARTALSFQASFDGDHDKYVKLGGEYQQAFNLLSAQNIRHQRVNFFDAPSVAAKLQRIRPLGQFTRGY